ncbi:SDR family NAD(P)-dependent oxidoreductase [Diaminobutyricibacter tongyongensis]|uniref:SDR family NAD(P)-dependent oxidoreductase n=1 Tax=Leifsonia tongyongensis TaxID=1268043 RepID=A0A6L9XUH5_9MICO|nr:SDR family NAD(P)-dependent oxidoreductase [Diaminobutyricibacter tongyongensis]NEN05051.1 SDR family NAD(P)-dependent oxidoreductase [Diaminobutyricibacter tongyongensis]
MARILVTGSTEGLGYATAEALLAEGHDVVVHARNDRRADALGPLLDRGADLLVADFADRDQTVNAVAELNDAAPIDVVIHNAGAVSGAAVMPVNVVAPFLFTAGLLGPRRHIYLSSGLHRGGRPSLDGVDWTGAHAAGSYSDSKLFVTTLSAAVARLRPDTLSNAVDPGWVPTRMGGAGAPDDLELGHRTQEWLAVSDDAEALTSGGYWYHSGLYQPHPAVHDRAFQDRLLASLEAATGVQLSPH